ncbi:MAG: hypothetical protein SGPRY_013491, partial [Prymnesium sp.]
VSLTYGGKQTELLVRRYTGVGDPAWTYPRREIGTRLFATFPTSWPYTAPDSFLRIDEQPDTTFYKLPRLVYHIDEPSVCALTRYYADTIAAGSDVLDICSSWVSHCEAKHCPLGTHTLRARSHLTARPRRLPSKDALNRGHGYLGARAQVKRAALQVRGERSQPLAQSAIS